MIHGTVGVDDGSPNGTTIYVESDKKRYGRLIQLDSSGSFRIWFEYGKDYLIKFSKPEYQTIQFYFSTIMPQGIKQCCFTPFDLSFQTKF